MAAKSILITQAQFDALNRSSNWSTVEINFHTLGVTPGIHRKHDLLGAFISGSLDIPKTLNGRTAVAGFDVLAHEPRPRTTRGEGLVNVYHYTITRTGRADFPFEITGAFTEGALQPHWPAELDLSPCQGL